MKIALVANGGGYITKKNSQLAGTTIFLKNLAEGLEERGFDAELMPSKMPGHAKLDFPLHRLLRIPQFIFTITARDSLEKYDVVHYVNHAFAGGPLPKKPAKLATSHLLGKSHFIVQSPGRGTAEILTERLYFSYASAIDRFSFQRMDRVVAASPFHAEDLCNSYSLERSKVSIIPPGIDLKKVKSTSRTDLHSKYGCDYLVTYISRLKGFRKGFPYLVEAAKSLKDRSIRFLIIGDGPDTDVFKKMAADNGVAERFVFLGWLDFDSKTAIQKSSDLIVIPSISESFCMVFAESLACGVPVVAFDMPFWKGLYDGAGIFVKKDARSLAEGIICGLEDPNTRKLLIARGLALAKKYDVKKSIESYIKQYEELSHSLS